MADKCKDCMTGIDLHRCEEHAGMVYYVYEPDKNPDCCGCHFEPFPFCPRCGNKLSKILEEQ